MSERPEEEPDSRADDDREEEIRRDMEDRGLVGDELERRFRELVAGLDSPKWPDEEPEPAEPPVNKPREEPTLLELWDADLPEDPDEAAETYTPPPPPPVPRPSGPAVVGLLLIIAGVALFLKPEFLGLGDAGVVIGAGVVLGGVAMLIWRLRPGDEEDPYDPEDGAVV